ncbi:MAG: hypothetical protein JSW71_06835, partial [Gemmatimonadota bacterium]
GIGQRSQHHGAKHAEDRRVGADPESERDDHDQAERGIPDALPQCKGDIPTHRVEQFGESDPTHLAPADLATLVLYDGDVPELSHRAGSSCLRGHTLCDQFVAASVQVVLQLRVYLSIHGAPTDRQPEDTPRTRNVTHAGSGRSSCSSIPTASTYCCQLDVWARSALRPLRVSL